MITTVSAANVADACLKLGTLYHCLPGVKPAHGAPTIAGPSFPVRHAGSVDVFLEAIGRAEPGDILLVDNQARTDEGCIGDLITLETKQAGLAGIVIWGCHRDHDEIGDIGLPMFSLGRSPSGPRSAYGRTAAIGEALLDGFPVARGQLLICDSDGVLIAASDDPRLIEEARLIRAKEAEQAEVMRSGRSLREQLDFSGYLEARQSDPDYSLRDHLRRVGGAVET